MNVRLHHSIEFTAGIYFDGVLRMNNYQVGLWMQTSTSDGESHNIAFDRLKFFISESLNSGVFINGNNEEQCNLLSAAGVKLIQLPDEPVDQLIGIMLYCKLNAICEDRMVIGEVELSSDLGGSVTYLHGEEEPIGPYDQAGWWHDSNLIHYNTAVQESENIMSLGSISSWRELDLQWPEDHDSSVEDTGNTIVFVNFGKDDTQPV
jgi:hypothetical protein